MEGQILYSCILLKFFSKVMDINSRTQANSLSLRRHNGRDNKAHLVNSEITLETGKV
jgi:hypothetical protein